MASSQEPVRRTRRSTDLFALTENDLSITQVRTNRRNRGGNRLPPDRYRERGPVYERVFEFGPDPERRDKGQRTATRRAVDLAVHLGELVPVLATALNQMMEASNDWLVGKPDAAGVRSTGWWELATIRKMVPNGLVAREDLANEAGSGDDAETKKRGARTAGRWMAELGRLGWVERVHRKPSFVNGEAQWTSNLWRIKMPDHLRLEVRGVQDAARARRGANKRGPGRTQPSKGGRPDDGSSKAQAAAAAIMAQNVGIRDNPCPACDGGGWTYDKAGRADERCRFCQGAGHLSGGP